MVRLYTASACHTVSPHTWSWWGRLVLIALRSSVWWPSFITFIPVNRSRKLKGLGHVIINIVWDVQCNHDAFNVHVPRISMSTTVRRLEMFDGCFCAIHGGDLVSSSLSSSLFLPHTVSFVTLLYLSFTFLWREATSCNVLAKLATC